MPTHGKRIATEKWQRIRAAYENCEGNCKQLGERFGVKPWAVSTRCRREQWRKSKAQMTENFNQHVAQKLEAKATDLVESFVEKQKRFTDRTFDEASAFLDQVQKAKQLLAVEDIEGLKTLVNTWRVPVEVGRQALGLDEQRRPVVNLGVSVHVQQLNCDTPNDVELVPLELPTAGAEPPLTAEPA